jgi:general nucleoside transport system permease protein
MANKSNTKTNPTQSFFTSILTNRAASLIIAVLLSLAFTSVVVLVMKASPTEVLNVILKGAFGSWGNITQVIQAWVPLILVASGLMFTFTAGLWNIGMEGQITMGAIFAYGTIRLFFGTDTPGGLVILLAIISGAFGGALWALLVGGLKIFGSVNEIFGGLGFNFIADAILLYLVYGPWKPEGVASGSTKMLDRIYWLPQVEGTYLSTWGLALAIVGVLFAFIILKGTYFGLKLKAVGKNSKSAFHLGVPKTRYMVISFLLCGIFAGLAGASQVTGFHHVLRNNIASGYGYLGLLVCMLSNFHPLISIFIAFFFMALNKGSNGLNIDLKLDSNLAGVIQGSLVLFVLMMDGVRKIVSRKRRGVAA